jgi:hypothetical protein
MDGSCTSFHYLRGELCTNISFSLDHCFGLPDKITSHHGLKFTSNLWAELGNMLNILHRQTAAYHTEANGAVERLHQRLKDALCAQCRHGYFGRGDPLGCPRIPFPAERRHWTFPSLAEAVFGTHLVFPNEFFQAEDFPVDQISKKYPKT